jgi:hypothetical protein
MPPDSWSAIDSSRLRGEQQNQATARTAKRLQEPCFRRKVRPTSPRAQMLDGKSEFLGVVLCRLCHVYF